MRFQINPTPIQTPTVKPLPKPPFIFQHSTFDEWLWFLDEYPELENRYRWRAGERLRKFHPDYMDDDPDEMDECYGIVFQENETVFYIASEDAFEDYASEMEVV